MTAPSLDLTEATIAAVDLIHTAIATYGTGRSLVSSAEVVDLLLDVRQALLRPVQRALEAVA